MTLPGKPSSGKRGATAPLSNSSDEDEPLESPVSTPRKTHLLPLPARSCNFSTARALSSPEIPSNNNNNVDMSINKNLVDQTLCISESYEASDLEVSCEQEMNVSDSEGDSDMKVGSFNDAMVCIPSCTFASLPLESTTVEVVTTQPDVASEGVVADKEMLEDKTNYFSGDQSNALGTNTAALSNNRASKLTLKCNDSEDGVSPSPLHSEHDYAASTSPVDHDYDNVASPGSSSTASGPTYARQPGFTHHAHDVLAAPANQQTEVSPNSHPSKVKKKKTSLEALPEPSPPKNKQKRDPLPMRLRALPQSFWQQPNVQNNLPPSNSNGYPVLPPLCTKDSESDLSDVRPISPPAGEQNKQDRVNRRSEWKITVADTELLNRLFDKVDKEGRSQKGVNGDASTYHPSGKVSTHHLKNRKSRRLTLQHAGVATTTNPASFLTEQDPYLVECVTEQLFPQLSLEQGTAGVTKVCNPLHMTPNSTLQVVTLREGDRSVTLPSLGVEQNYSQMLSELVTHI